MQNFDNILIKIWWLLGILRNPANIVEKFDYEIIISNEMFKKVRYIMPNLFWTQPCKVKVA